MAEARMVVASLLVVGVLGLTACGSDDKDNSAAATKSVSPQRAIAEIDKTRAGLDKASTAYAAGDAKQADETIAETYVDHYELVEPTLAKKDNALMQKIESNISAQIRAQIKQKVPKAQLQALIKRTEADLDTAEAKLK